LGDTCTGKRRGAVGPCALGGAARRTGWSGATAPFLHSCTRRNTTLNTQHSTLNTQHSTLKTRGLVQAVHCAIPRFAPRHAAQAAQMSAPKSLPLLLASEDRSSAISRSFASSSARRRATCAHAGRRLQAQRACCARGVAPAAAPVGKDKRQGASYVGRTSLSLPALKTCFFSSAAPNGVIESAASYLRHQLASRPAGAML